MKTKYILGSLSITLSLILNIILILILSYLKITKTIYIATLIILTIIVTTILIKLYLNKKQIKYNIGIFLSIFLCIISIYTLYEIEEKYDYLKVITNKNLTYENYNIYVLKKNTIYNNLAKLENKKIGLLEENNQNIKEYLEDKVNIEYIIYSNFQEISIAIQNGEIQSFILNEKEYNKLSKEDKEIFTKTRIIYNSKIKTNI